MKIIRKKKGKYISRSRKLYRKKKWKKKYIVGFESYIKRKKRKKKKNSSHKESNDKV